MLWSHSPRPQGFACPGLGLLGPSIPPHDPSPGPHTPGGNSRGSPWPPVPKRETTVGKSHLREVAQEEITFAEGPSALPHCPWGESQNLDFWEVLVQTCAGPFCIIQRQGSLWDSPHSTESHPVPGDNGDPPSP